MQTIESYTANCDSVFVVLPEKRDELRRIVEQTDAKVILNSKSSQGMSQSIVAGVSQTEQASGWLIGLADMPFVKQATIKQLLQRSVGQSILRPVYQSKTGNPVYFDAKYKTMLCALQGDQGAREMLSSLQNQIGYIEVDDHGVLQDVDTPEDLLNYAKS